MAIWDNLQCHNTRLPLGHTTILTQWVLDTMLIGPSASGRLLV